MKARVLDREIRAATVLAAAIFVAAIGPSACGARTGLPIGGDNRAGAGSSASSASTTGTGGAASSSSSSATTGAGGMADDFPDPILDPGTPIGAPGLFGGPDQDGPGPCLYEPELGALVPKNWQRLRFRYLSPADANLFEIKLVIPGEQSPLVIYTSQTSYTLDKATWQKLTQVAAGTTMHVTLRAAVESNGALVGGPWLGSTGDLSIAPVDAKGGIVYWTTTGGTNLKGFKIGDETVQSVIAPPQTGAACVGCHNSTPDGKYVALTASDAPDDGHPSSIRVLSVDGNGSEPPFLTAGAKALLARQPQFAPSLSKAHWSPGDRTLLSMMVLDNSTEIIWTDLEAKSQAMNQGWGLINREADAGNASAATLSHDGKTIVYTSTISTDSGTITHDGALFTVPYNNRQGGPASALNGASLPSFQYYYPSFSADDAYLIMNRVPAGETSYTNSEAEVFVLPSGDGEATRLAANDPPACLGLVSPGVTNSWPRWSADVATLNGKTYYFMVFSSTRDPSANGSPQLYVTSMVAEKGKLTTYSAIYLWNQPEAEHNHTPAWDDFQLP